jgi:beta-lactam-binding protein with PASTA domain
MDASTPPPKGGGLFGWVARKPKLAFFVTAGVALMIGAGLGAAGGVSQSQLDDANAKADDAERKLAQVSRERDELQADREELQGDLASATDRADTSEAAIKKLTAKADVPDFTGDTVADARGNDRVDLLGWKIRTVTRETTSASPGTVLSQKPAEGRTLGSGRSITLTVAKKPPPKPKQWVTITTLQGDSSTKTEEFTVPRGAKARLVYSMPGDTNNAIILYKAPKEYIDLLLNEIGPQQGTTRLYEPGRFYLDVTGSYTIQIQVFKRPA